MRRNCFSIFKSKKEGDKKALSIIKKQIRQKPHSLIGLAVGKTTDSLHKLISIDAKHNPRLWKNIKILQIDENVGYSPRSKKSFNNELKNELKDLIEILDKENIFLMDGTKNPKQTIKATKDFIKKCGGIDLITLGIGPEPDPHIAYNTTGESSLNSSVRVVKLHPLIAKKLNPKAKGITIGVKEILSSRKIILLAYGANKIPSIKLAFNGKIDMKKASASALQKHKCLNVILDKAAGKAIK